VGSFDLKKSKGQALAEMIIVIPLLMIMLVGVVQLTALFQARIAFEKISGDVAREYAAKTINDSSAFAQEFWTRLGPYQSLFVQSSISVASQPPQPSAIDSLLDAFDTLGPIAAQIKSYFINYEGQTWSVSINCVPPFFPLSVLPNGIQFQTTVTLLRYPA